MLMSAENAKGQTLITHRIDTSQLIDQHSLLRLHVHTHTRLAALFPGLPGLAGTRNVKPIWILLKQETVSGSGISWAICKSAPCFRQITTPATHHSWFFTGRMPSCHPTNSVKALKAKLQGSEMGRNGMRRKWRARRYKRG